MRSYQFETLPSLWSEPQAVEFVLIKRPLPVNEVTVNFSRIGMQYSGGDPFVVVDGHVTWPQPNVKAPTLIIDYNVIINQNESIREVSCRHV